jgi:hypothetical protein
MLLKDRFNYYIRSMKIFAYILACIAVAPWALYTYDSLYRIVVLYQFGFGNREFTLRELILVISIPIIIAATAVYIYYELNRRKMYAAIVIFSPILLLLFFLWLIYIAGGIPISTSEMIY